MVSFSNVIKSSSCNFWKKEKKKTGKTEQQVVRSNLYQYFWKRQNVRGTGRCTPGNLEMCGFYFQYIYIYIYCARDLK